MACRLCEFAHTPRLGPVDAPPINAAVTAIATANAYAEAPSGHENKIGHNGLMKCFSKKFKSVTRYGNNTVS